MINAHLSAFVTVEGANKVAPARLEIGDFAISGAGITARMLSDKSGGNVFHGVVDGTAMLLTCFDKDNHRVRYVTEAARDQAITNGRPARFGSDSTCTVAQSSA